MGFSFSHKIGTADFVVDLSAYFHYKITISDFVILIGLTDSIGSLGPAIITEDFNKILLRFM